MNLDCGWSGWTWCRFCGRWKLQTWCSAVLQCLTLAACSSLERQPAACDQWSFRWPCPVNGPTITLTAHRSSRSAVAADSLPCLLSHFYSLDWLMTMLVRYAIKALPGAFWSGSITTADSMSMWIPFPSWAARIEWSHFFYSSPIQPQHILHWLLPRLKESGHNLRSRGHSLFCSVLQPSSIWGLATPLTYFLHLSLSSVILIDSSRGSPVHVLMLSICAMCGLLCLRAPGIVPRIISSSFSSVVDRHTKCMRQPRSCL